MTDRSVHHRFIEPLDVLFLRGNKLFGDPGSHGESLVPPWPSVAAGALRSAMLAREGVDPAAFAKDLIEHASLGTPKRPGPFTVIAFSLARRRADGSIESLHPLPADLVALTGSDARIADLQRMMPAAPAQGLLSSVPAALWPVLAQPDRAKAATDVWLSQAGWEEYLRGRVPTPAHAMRAGELWSYDARVGVGLDAVTGRAADGQLFSSQAVAFQPGVGFLAGVAGAEPPTGGLLRLGGDGRGAAVTAVTHRLQGADLEAIAKARRARVVLTTPGIFPEGWGLPGANQQQRLNWPGITARVACAAVPRAEIVSGWDIARLSPKPAEHAAPAGSVYWLDELEATPDSLRKLAESGLWLDDHQNPHRRAEGFNRFVFAAW